MNVCSITYLTTSNEGDIYRLYPGLRKNRSGASPAGLGERGERSPRFGEHGCEAARSP